MRFITDPKNCIATVYSEGLRPHPCQKGKQAGSEYCYSHNMEKRRERREAEEERQKSYYQRLKEKNEKNNN
jgi:hypothetical protein